MCGGLSNVRKKDVKPKVKKESTKIPPHVFINGSKYSIVRAWAIKNDKGEVLDGDVSFAEKKIRLAHGLTKEELLETYLHEYIHAFNHEFGLYNFITDEVDEVFTHQLSKDLLKSFKIKST